jgi:hypothetical protein
MLIATLLYCVGILKEARCGCENMRVTGPFFVLSLIVSAALAGCAPSTHVLVGQARPPISPEQVKIYSRPPATPYEEVAVLDASSKSAFSAGGQKSVDKVIERLKVEAAKLGANGVILEGFRDAETGSIGTGVGSDSYGNHSAVGVGVGGSLGIYKKTGHGEAIYVPQPAP